jgi:hypothetical protein
MIEQFYLRDDYPRKYPGLSHWISTIPNIIAKRVDLRPALFLSKNRVKLQNVGLIGKKFNKPFIVG